MILLRRRVLISFVMVRKEQLGTVQKQMSVNGATNFCKTKSTKHTSNIGLRVSDTSSVNKVYNNINTVNKVENVYSEQQ